MDSIMTVPQYEFYYIVGAVERDFFMRCWYVYLKHRTGVKPKPGNQTTADKTLPPSANVLLHIAVFVY